jgi:hypothetical protein
MASPLLQTLVLLVLAKALVVNLYDGEGSSIVDSCRLPCFGSTGMLLDERMTE